MKTVSKLWSSIESWYSGQPGRYRVRVPKEQEAALRSTRSSPSPAHSVIFASCRFTTRTYNVRANPLGTISRHDFRLHRNSEAASLKRPYLMRLRNCRASGRRWKIMVFEALSSCLTAQSGTIIFMGHLCYKTVNLWRESREIRQHFFHHCELNHK